MSAWLTEANATNLISSPEYVTEYRWAQVTWAGFVINEYQRKVAKRTTNRYVGVLHSSAESICSTLKETRGTISCGASDPIGGGCDITHVIETVILDWTAVA